MPAAARQQLRHDLGVERRPAVGHAPERIQELAHVGHAVLQQVADAARVARQQLGRVALLDVLRQHEHRPFRASGRGSRWPRGGPRPCRSAACERRPRRHRAVRARPRSPARCASLHGGRRPRALRRSSSRASPSRSSTASSAITTRTATPPCRTVGPPSGESRWNSPSSVDTRSRRPARPGAARRVGPADAVVLHLDREPVAAARRTVTLARGGAEHASRCSRAPRRPRSTRRASTDAGGRVGHLHVDTSTGIGHRAASADSAASSPRSVSTAG